MSDAASTACQWVKVADADDMQEEEIKPVEILGQSIAIYRLADDEFYATHNICTHEVACLSDGWMDGYMVECPLHGGKFDVRNGEGQGAPITEPVAVFPIRVVDGEVLLDVSTLKDD